MCFYSQELLAKLDYSKAHCSTSITYKNCFLVFQVKITSHLKIEVIYIYRGKPKILFFKVGWGLGGTESWEVVTGPKLLFA